VVAVLVAVGLAVTCWWVVRGDAAAPTGWRQPGDHADGSRAVTGGASTDAPPVRRVIVDVAGKVRHPGIVVLTPGARVVDA
jgi:competence protein ComEA